MRKIPGAGVVLAVVLLVFAAVGSAAEIQGKIKSVDAQGRTVTLEDGMKLTLSSNVQVSRESLKPGATVKASYEDMGGDKVVKSIQVTPAR